MNKSQKILYSIKPVYADRIVGGMKKFEFRTKKPKSLFNCIVIYWTSPVMEIRAEVEVVDILEYAPEKMWELTKNEAGISENDFLKYFKGRDKAYAFKLGKVIPYSEPKKLSDFGIRSAPQSFAYLK
jgi:predicted transcriptional regulator